MKKKIFKILSICLCALNFVLVSCNSVTNENSIESSTSDIESIEQIHECSFKEKIAEEMYLKEAATCQAPAKYYYSCTCGEKGMESFQYGRANNCEFTQEIEDDKYLKEPATCTTHAVYYKSCAVCGGKGNYFQTFTSGELGVCDFSKEIAEEKYLYAEATKSSAALYYKSCSCGNVGTDVFPYGEPLKTYTEEEKIPYTPVSLTITLYDSENSIYGFTCNTQAKPLRPVLQIAKGDSLSGDIEEYIVDVEKASSYETDEVTLSYYILKTEVALDANTAYTYRIYDKYVETGTNIATMQTKDTKANSFSFVHVADTQQYPAQFKDVLKSVVGNTDFLLHTGDVVEYSKYEHEWKAMLEGNFEYLSKIPMMAISGNHETTYRNGANETFKHFNNKIPAQDTQLGYFYSFIYGNAKFIMLNTNVLAGNKLTGEQYDWLVKELTDNDATWTIVAMHNPMYSVGQYGANPSRNTISIALRAQLQGVFAQYGVDIVLQGHDHTVSRTYPIDANGQPQTETFETIGEVEYSINPNGVLYLMNGTAGGQWRDPHSVDENLYKYAQGSKISSWAQFEISGGILKVSVNYYTSNGIQTYQTWGIKKTA